MNVDVSFTVRCLQPTFDDVLEIWDDSDLMYVFDKCKNSRFIYLDVGEIEIINSKPLPTSRTQAQIEALHQPESELQIDVQPQAGIELVNEHQHQIQNVPTNELELEL